MGRHGVKAGTRELAIHKLPYIVVYKVVEADPEGFVDVVAIYHVAQDRSSDHAE
jgi:hypothetical protein